MAIEVYQFTAGPIVLPRKFVFHDDHLAAMRDQREDILKAMEDYCAGSHMVAVGDILDVVRRFGAAGEEAREDG